ncbi:hypothetical protein GUJ93_ZPchr0007g4805 [Zizania palustris]|uniref:Uncharacterized protein n=1 Tax=Zizania palustris TaxID=103762 RepID=A0A8J5VS95_ZIZPA|nr:hypothetical protein GUJ93_ZPchr0007g4805 [Zizania palustris]
MRRGAPKKKRARGLASPAHFPPERGRLGTRALLPRLASFSAHFPQSVHGGSAAKRRSGALKTFSAIQH